MPRPRNKRPVSVKVYQSDYDGLWHGYITVGVKPDGSPDVRHRSGQTLEECEDKIRKLENARDAKTVTKPGRPPKVAAYLTEWLQEVERLRSHNTAKSYHTVVHQYLIPHLGGYRLDELGVDHVKSMLTAVEERVSAQAAAKAHRVLRSALSTAVREEKLTRNVAKLVSAPAADVDEITPLTKAEAEAVLAEVQRLERHQSRWLLALTMGMRQGECLGLARYRPGKPRAASDVDLETGTLTVREQLQRRSWRHGCSDPAACARKHCRTKPCPPTYRHGCPDPAQCSKKLAYRCPARAVEPGCGRHPGVKGCPPLCRRGCVGHAKGCPERTGGGLVVQPPKSAAGRRSIALPPPVLDAIRIDALRQDNERREAGEWWTDTGLLYTTRRGTPIDPRVDYQEWCDLLARAGVAHARLHDARHTAATFLLVLGVDKRTVMDIMGWSQESMLKRYQHVVDELRQEAARRITGLWWGTPAAGGDQPAEPTTKRRKGHLRVV